ncbi:MAG: DUF433 domain-containing protein [Gemmatimonadaceae bacterium]
MDTPVLMQKNNAAKRFTAPEAAWLAELSLKAVNATIDRGEIELIRSGARRDPARQLGTADVLYLALRKLLSDKLSHGAKRELYGGLVESSLADRIWAKRWVARDSECTIRLADGVIAIDAKATCLRLAKRWNALSDGNDMVISDPAIRGGEPVIRGTRVPVHLIADLVEQGADEREILEDYPSLSAKKVRAATAYANTHPRRGRPRKPPWKDTPIALATSKSVSS